MESVRDCTVAMSGLATDAAGTLIGVAGGDDAAREIGNVVDDVLDYIIGTEDWAWDW